MTNITTFANAVQVYDPRLFAVLLSLSFVRIYPFSKAISNVNFLICFLDFLTTKELSSSECCMNFIGIFFKKTTFTTAIATGIY